MTEANKMLELADKLTAMAHGLFSAKEAGLLLEAAKFIRSAAAPLGTEIREAPETPREIELRQALEDCLDAVDDMRLVKGSRICVTPSSKENQ